MANNISLQWDQFLPTGNKVWWTNETANPAVMYRIEQDGNEFEVMGSGPDSNPLFPQRHPSLEAAKLAAELHAKGGA